MFITELNFAKAKTIMTPEIAYLSKILKEDYLQSKLKIEVSVSETLFLNKEFEDKLNLLVIDPSKLVQEFQGKILAYFYVSSLSEEKLEETMAVVSINSPQKEEPQLSWGFYMNKIFKIEYRSSCVTELKNFLSSLKNNFQEIEIGIP